MDFFEAIELRHSYRRAFLDTPVPEADLLKIIDAGLRAPSGCNKQTTDFIIVENKELRARISAMLNHENIRTAPVLVILVTEKYTFDFGLDFEIEDYSAAVENILLAATALGYASCWMDGVTRTSDKCGKIAELLDVPNGKQVRCVLPIGIPNEKGNQAARKPFEERVVWKK